MQFRVLGPLEVERDGVVVDIGPRKQREVLALLLLHPGRVVSSERILEAVWGEDQPASENALWVTVSRLRAALAGEAASSPLATREHGYALDIDPDDLDAVRFEHLVGEARRHRDSDPEAARRHLEEALGLWRGDAFADVAYRDFALPEARRLEELRVTATEDLSELRLRAGDDGELIGDLQALVLRHPLRERPVALLMLALHRSGRQAEALAAFADLERRLGEELGLEPSPELRRLEERILLHDPVVAPVRTVAAGTNPFRGLLPFREADTGVFFGRDRIVADVVRKLSTGETLVTAIGASGSGKTSLLRAGVVPALGKGALVGSDRWLVGTMVPGSHPFAELEAALIRASLDAPDTLTDQLSDPETGILRAVMRVLPTEDDRLVLVVDQLEEVFTLTGPAERDRFLSGLVAAADDVRHRVVVLTGLRADFYPHALEHPAFAGRFDAGIVNVPPLLPSELEEAAVRPAMQAGRDVEPGMLAALLTDVAGRPGSLPLFEYLLTDLFDHTDGPLTLEAYREAGGAAGALARRAEEVFGRLAPAEQDAVRQVFLRLANPTDVDAPGWTRRRLPARELRSLGIDPAALGSAIGALVDARLITTDRDPVTGRPVVDIAHEALLAEWPRLAGWLDDARDDLHRHVALTTAMADWRRADDDPGYLWSDARLADYATWADRSDLALTDEERHFLDESHRLATRRSEAAARQGRRQRRQTWGFAVVVIALLIVGGFALWELLSPPSPEVLLIDAPIGGVISDQHVAGMADVERRLGAATDVLRPEIDAVQIDEALDSGPDVVVIALDTGNIFPNYDWSAALATHPEIRFVDLGFAPLVDDDHPDRDRWAWVGFENPKGAFLAGAVAAARTRSGVVGFVGAHPGLVEDFRAGFEAGATHVDSEVAVVSAYTPTRYHPFLNFEDDEADRAATVAEAVIAEGADVVFNAHGEAQIGVLRAVASARSAGADLWAIGVDSDQYLALSDDEPGTADAVLTSMVKRFDRAIFLAVEQALSGVSNDLVMNLDNGGFSMANAADRLTDDELAIVDEATTGIISGRIEVPPWPLAAPSLEPPDTVVLMATADASGRRMTQPTTLEVGTVVTLLGRHDAGGITDLMGLAIGRPAAGLGPTDLANNSPPDLAPFSPDLWEIGMAHNWTAVPPGGTGAISVVLAEPGTWAIGCATFGDEGGATWATFEVVPAG